MSHSSIGLCKKYSRSGGNKVPECMRPLVLAEHNIASYKLNNEVMNDNQEEFAAPQFSICPTTTRVGNGMISFPSDIDYKISHCSLENIIKESNGIRCVCMDITSSIFIVTKPKCEKLFQYEICSKDFTQKCHLLSHMLIHTGENLFQCEICSKDFTNKSVLIRHQLIHTGEKLFQCEICSKDFTQKCNLLSHKLIHTDISLYILKLFQCEICSKDFTNKSVLIRHQLIHTGEKLFQCEICSKDFTQKCNLLSHMLIHTGEKP
ncbi:unnamed protein product, partial [Meganyctiphanes norvegica]